MQTGTSDSSGRLAGLCLVEPLSTHTPAHTALPACCRLLDALHSSTERLRQLPMNGNVVFPPKRGGSGRPGPQRVNTAGGRASPYSVRWSPDHRLFARVRPTLTPPFARLTPVVSTTAASSRRTRCRRQVAARPLRRRLGPVQPLDQLQCDPRKAAGPAGRLAQPATVRRSHSCRSARPECARGTCCDSGKRGARDQGVECRGAARGGKACQPRADGGAEGARRAVAAAERAREGEAGEGQDCEGGGSRFRCPGRRARDRHECRGRPGAFSSAACSRRPC